MESFYDTYGAQGVDACKGRTNDRYEIYLLLV